MARWHRGRSRARCKGCAGRRRRHREDGGPCAPRSSTAPACQFQRSFTRCARRAPGGEFAASCRYRNAVQAPAVLCPSVAGRFCSATRLSSPSFFAVAHLANAETGLCWRSLVMFCSRKGDSLAAPFMPGGWRRCPRVRVVRSPSQEFTSQRRSCSGRRDASPGSHRSSTRRAGYRAATR